MPKPQMNPSHSEKKRADAQNNHHFQERVIKKCLTSPLWTYSLSTTQLRGGRRRTPTFWSWWGRWGHNAGPQQVDVESQGGLWTLAERSGKRMARLVISVTRKHSKKANKPLLLGQCWAFSSSGRTFRDGVDEGKKGCPAGRATFHAVGGRWRWRISVFFSVFFSVF